MSAVMIGDTRIVVHIAEGEEDPEQLSKMLSEMSNVIAVIGVKEKSAKVFVSKSADVDVDCRTALKEIMKLVGGGGGGKKRVRHGWRRGPGEAARHLRQGAGDAAHHVPEMTVPETFSIILPGQSGR